jgi:hypothetical protein
MWPRVLLTGAVIASTVCTVSAQTATADGVAALARGEYQRAIEILKPIAEDGRTTDAAAQFFMAGLYESGRGVPLDPLRACALYMRASNNHDSPFGRQASMLLRSKSIARGAEFNDECQLLANLGFDHGFEPVTFQLGPVHFVKWTLSEVTVTSAIGPNARTWALHCQGRDSCRCGIPSLPRGRRALCHDTSSRCLPGTPRHGRGRGDCGGMSLKLSPTRSSRSMSQGRSPRPTVMCLRRGRRSMSASMPSCAWMTRGMSSGPS